MAPIRFWRTIIFKALYFVVSFLTYAEYNKADPTARKRKAMPLGSAFRLRSGFTIIMIMPKNETIMPNHEKIPVRSRVNKKATKGLNRGIVAIITDEMVEETNFNP